MTDVAQACADLAAAEKACKDIPPWLPHRLYKRRMDKAMARWRRANAALFDAQITRLDWRPWER